MLGVDPGTRVCGYGVVDVTGRGTWKYVECGVLTAATRATAEARLGEIARSLIEVVEELSPGMMAVEGVFAARNVRSALALAHARGVALAVAGLAGVPVRSYAPAVIKKTVTGSGRASKLQVARMVQALAGLRQLPRADAADALAVAITCARAEGRR